MLSAVRTLLAVVVMLGSSCGPSVYERVKNAHDLDTARSQLRGVEPSITKYPPNAEAWYFGKNECVLFIDGKVRLSRSSYTQRGDVAVASWRERQVLCSPSEVREHEAQSTGP